jgi:photosystem II stability/assembly factor-like uncharacterized protein
VPTLRRLTENSLKKSGLILTTFKSNTIGLFSKRDLVIIAFFTLLGLGGAFAATLITISTPDSQGAGYVAATACDENLTIKALTASDTATGQLYVATIALSDISQNATTGCGNKTMQVALKINNQMRYATWDIPEASTDSTFYLTGATSSISDYYADTAISPFQADGLTNVAIAKIGSFTSTYSWSQVASSQIWWSITSSSDGTKLAAVVAGAGGNIYTSTDSGATWTQQTASGSRDWRSITSSSDGTKLAAVVNNGYIYTSTDSGATWTERTNAGGGVTGASLNRYWASITSSSDGTKLAAVQAYGYIWTSTDSGVTWTERSPVTASTQRAWRSITSSSDGTKLAAVVNGGYIYTSTDSGATWTVRQPINATNRYWYSITSSSDGTKLAAAVENGYIYTSSDSGVNWTVRQPIDATNRYWRSITSSSDGTKLAAAVEGGYIYTSSDSGASWTTNLNLSGIRSWLSITSSSDGTKLAAGVNSGWIYRYVRSISRSSN